MKSVLITGGSGHVGRFIVDDLHAHGWRVTIAGRTAPAAGSFPHDIEFLPFDLHPNSDFSTTIQGFDAFVHAGFSHIDGSYRGGEGDDIKDFWDRNFLASLRLFQAAMTIGVERTIFLSSRAVYGRQPPGLNLSEETSCDPDTHYGLIKRACEQYLQDAAGRYGLCTASLRVTGVYGQFDRHATDKWQSLIEDYLSGRPISPRIGTEVHGRDVASAIRLMLEYESSKIGGAVFNVSDMALDRGDILAPVRRHFGCEHPLPAQADASILNVMDTTRISRLGWKPGGKALFRQTMTEIIANQLSPS